MNELRLTVPGTPTPQGSKNAYVRGGRAILVEASGPRLREWRDAIAWHARSAATASGWIRSSGPIAVRLMFHVKQPARPRHERPTPKPDLDKLIRAVLDALTIAGCIWHDDSQVVELEAAKWYTEQPRLEAHLRELPSGNAVAPATTSP